MKKKIVALLLMMCLGATALTGCGDKNGSKEETTQKEELKDFDIDQYVKLGEYKGITLEKTVTEITDENVEEEIKAALSENPAELTDASATVQNGDTVNLAFEGKVDGETFEGGSSDSYDLEIGSGRFIAGFEDGMVGMKKGESRDLNLTFPENYKEGLAGKPVVFSVTVHSIKRPQTEIDDAWVVANSDVETVDAYKKSIREKLEKDADKNAGIALKSSALETVVENAEILDYPEHELKAGEAVYEQNLSALAGMYGVELKDLLEAQGISDEDYKKQKAEYGRTVATSSMVVQAIAKAEGLTEKDQEYKDLLAAYMEGSGLSEKEFMEQYGEESVKKTIMMDRVCKIIIKEASINEVTAQEEETPADGETEE